MIIKVFLRGFESHMMPQVYVPPIRMTQRALSALQGEVVVDRNRSLVGVDLNPKRFVTPDHRPYQLTIGKTCNALVDVSSANLLGTPFLLKC